MTEQEAEAFAARLTRIWNPKQVPRQSGSYIRDTVFSFVGEISPGVNFGFNVREGEVPHAAMHWNRCEMQRFQGKIESNYAAGASVEPEQWDVLLPEFVERWLPFFRRGCWLSGCPIEATAHEKAEWMRVFTHEEIESWNLKF